MVKIRNALLLCAVVGHTAAMMAVTRDSDGIVSETEFSEVPPAAAKEKALDNIVGEMSKTIKDGADAVTPIDDPKPTGLAQTSADGPVYAQCLVAFGDAKYKPYMYNCICPIAATQMLGCMRCAKTSAQLKQMPGKRDLGFGGCNEFLKFANRASFDQYKTYSWAMGHHWSHFSGSKSTVNPKGFKEISKAEYEAAEKNSGCELVTPNANPTTWMDSGKEKQCTEGRSGSFF